MNLTFDWTISFGHVLTVVTLGLGAVAAWSRLEHLLARMEERIAGHDRILLTHEDRINETEKRTFQLASNKSA